MHFQTLNWPNIYYRLWVALIPLGWMFGHKQFLWELSNSNDTKMELGLLSNNVLRNLQNKLNRIWTNSMAAPASDWSPSHLPNEMTFCSIQQHVCTFLDVHFSIARLCLFYLKTMKMFYTSYSYPITSHKPLCNTCYFFCETVSTLIHLMHLPAKYLRKPWKLTPPPALLFPSVTPSSLAVL